MNPPSKLLDCEGDLGDLLNYTQIDMLNYRKFALGLKNIYKQSLLLLPPACLQ